MDIIEIVFTVVFVVVIASIIGWSIRKFNITTTHLGILWVLGFVILLIGGGISTAIAVIGVIILTYASGGFFYMYFMGVKNRPPDIDFYIKPPRGWEITNDPEFVFCFAEPTEDSFGYVESGVYTESLEKLVQDFKSMVSSNQSFVDLKFISERNCTVANNPCYEMVFSYILEGQHPQQQQKNILVSNERFYGISFTTLQKYYEKNKPLFEESIESFRIL